MILAYLVFCRYRVPFVLSRHAYYGNWEPGLLSIALFHGNGFFVSLVFDSRGGVCVYQVVWRHIPPSMMAPGMGGHELQYGVDFEHESRTR